MLHGLSDEIRRDSQHAVIATTNPYQGQRFRSEARLAGKIYGEPFHVDVVSGGLMPRPPDRIPAGEFFKFAGLPPFEVAVYARVVHIAEKLHAYTYPYPATNSRVRDLPDLGLLARSGPYDAATLQRTIAAVFAHRATHPVPSKLPRPPAGWAAVYASLAQENALQWPTIDVLFKAVEAFLQPVLEGRTGTDEDAHHLTSTARQDSRRARPAARARGAGSLGGHVDRRACFQRSSMSRRGSGMSRPGFRSRIGPNR